MERLQRQRMAIFPVLAATALCLCCLCAGPITANAAEANGATIPAVTSQDQVATQSEPSVNFSSNQPLAWDEYQGLTTQHSDGGAITPQSASDGIIRLNGDGINTSASVPVVLPLYLYQDQSWTRAIDRIRKIRSEAWNTPSVRKYLNIPSGMTESQYVNINWNVDLERIAIQRAFENTVLWEHVRPNGESCSTAKSNGVSSSAEVIAKSWPANSSAYTYGIEMWYSEKQEFINEKGEWSSADGHYAAMVSPSYTTFGYCFGCTSSASYYTGEFSGSAPATPSTSTNYSGKCHADVRISSDQAKPVQLHLASGSNVVSAREYIQAYGTVDINSHTYSVDVEAGTGSLTVADTSIAGIDSGSWVYGKKAGNTTLTYKEGGQTATLNIHVPKYTRLWGDGALDTMEAIIDTGFSTKSGGTVVIATDGGYWDALSASGVAGALNAPVLLTNGGSLSSQTSAEISRIGATRAVIIGGNGAITAKVESQIASLVGGSSHVTRMYGDSASDTARAIYQQAPSKLGITWGNTCIVVTPNTFQDALSIAPYAYAKHDPVLLVESKSLDLSSATLSAIKSGSFNTSIIVGGQYVVSTNVDGKLKSATGGCKRLYGNSAYDTSRETALWEISQGMQTNGMGVSTGEMYFDALTGASLCGKNNAVLVLASDADKTGRTCISNVISPNRSSISNLYIFGGRGVITENLATAIDSALG